MPDNQSQTSLTTGKINPILFFITGLVILILVGLSGFFLQRDKKSQLNPKSGVVTKLLKEDYQLVNGSFYYHNCMFSPDGYHTACLKYTYKDNLSSTETLVVDGQEKSIFEGVNGIQELQYSADGRLAYITQKNDQMFVVIDGKEAKSYPLVRSLTFSKNGKHYAYCIGKDRYEVGKSPFTHFEYKSASIVLDGQEKKDFTFSKSLEGYCVPIFSPDGNHLIFSMQDNGKNILLLDEKEVNSSAESSFGTPIFSGDSSKIYFVLKDVPTMIDLSGKVVKNINNVGSIIYSKDLSTDKTGDKLLFVSSNVDGGPQSLYLNGDKIIESHSIWNPFLSEDGNSLIYTSLVIGDKVMIGDEDTSPIAHVILNNKEIETYRTFDTRVSPPVFSKNGKYVAYISDTLASGSRINIDPTLSKLVIASAQKVCKIPFKGAPLSGKNYTTTAPLEAPIFADNQNISFGYKLGEELIWNIGKINMDNCSLDN